MTLDAPDLLQTRLFIDGAWRDARAGKRFHVDDPATGGTVAEVADGDAADADDAIAAAARALPAWRALSATERGTLLLRWWRLIDEHAEDLARLMSWGRHPRSS